MRILYDSLKSEYKSPFGAVRCGEAVRINVKIPVTCPSDEVKIIITDEAGFLLKDRLVLVNEGSVYKTYSVELSLYRTGAYLYYFEITNGDTSFKLYRYGLHDTNIEDGEMWQLTVYPKDYETPDGMKGKIIYQIFPDRFNKVGSPDISAKLTPYRLHESTDEVPYFMPDANGSVWNNDFYGGNLAGIADKADYVASLGVGIVYLNPIAMAFSNHRYDTADYKRIDPMLGTEDDFRHLADELHRRNIKLIIDGVFSHVGSDSIYFDDKHRFGTGAVSNPSSPYRSWFSFRSFPNDYEAWWGVRTLPCVDEMNDGFLDYVIRDDDSVVAHYLSLGADGFRLDVVDEIPDAFLAMLRMRVKEIKPDAIIIGEVWEDASNKVSYGIKRRYFADGELDSTMNYPFRTAIIDFVSGKTAPADFESTVMTICEHYPKEALACLMNSLSTHDTPRILSLISGVTYETKDERAHAVLSEADRLRAVTLEKQAAALQFVLPGNPSIYYGDEIGMEGYEDPLNRGYFKWDNIDGDILSFYRMLAEVKSQIEPNAETEVTTENGLLVVSRGKIKIAANNTETVIPYSCDDVIMASLYDNCGIAPHGFVIHS